MPARIGIVELHIGGFDGERAALGHGVACVDSQFHQHLLKLAGVGADTAQIRPQFQAQVDIFPDEPLQHGPQAGHRLVQVDNLQLQHLAPAERQELIGKSPGALTRLHYLLGGMAILVAGLQVVQNELGIPIDNGEKVIEIVRHAAGQHAHGFHFLRLP